MLNPEIGILMTTKLQKELIRFSNDFIWPQPFDNRANTYYGILFQVYRLKFHQSTKLDQGLWNTSYSSPKVPSPDHLLQTNFKT